MSGNSNSVPRAIIPTESELALSLDERLASMWNRNAGQVREQFSDREAFLRRFGADRSMTEEKNTR